MATKPAAVRLHSAGGMQSAQSRIRYLAPNLRVDREDLRPDTLSYPAFFAAVSRALGKCPANH